MVNANVWAPGTTINIDSESKLVSQRLVAEEGQNIFNLTDFTYTMSVNALSVYVDGERKIINYDWRELTTSSFYIEDIEAGAVVEAVGQTALTSVVETVEAYGIVYSLTALAVYEGDESSVYVAYGDRSGWFNFEDEDLSTEVAADTTQGMYVAPDADSTGASGAWVRQLEDGIYLEHFGITEEDTDYLTEMTELFNLGLPIRTKQRNKRFNLSDVVTAEDVNIDADLGGNTFVSTGENERCFFFRTNFGSTFTVSDVSFTSGRTVITTDDEHGYAAGDKVKLFSNENINPNSGFTQQRCAEYFVVESVTDFTITCIGRFIWAYDTDDNPRVAKMGEHTLRFDNVNIDRTLAHNDGEYAVAINMIGYYEPIINNIHADYFTGQLLNMISCYRGKMRNISADELLDDTSTNAVGYVGVDYACQENEWYQLNGGKVRHTYTTGAASIDADDTSVHNYGGAVRCHVYSGVTVGCTNFAYDTHQDAWECEFHDITVYDDYSTTYAASGGFQDRSQNTVVHKLTYISDGDDVSAGEQAVLFNTGAKNTRIEHIVFKSKGGCINSYGLYNGYTSNTLSQEAFHIGKIDAYMTKGLPTLVEMGEGYTLDIGEINVIPADLDVGYHGAGGGKLFVLANADANLRVKALNLFFDARGIAAQSVAGDYIARLDADFGVLDLTINNYVNDITYERFEQQLSGVRNTNEDEEVYTMERATLRWNAFINNYDDALTAAGDTLREAFFFDEYVAGTLQYTYSVMGDGQRKPDGYLLTEQAIYDADSTIVLYPESSYSLRETNGDNIAEKRTGTISSQSTTSTVSSIDAPTFEGQEFELYLNKWNSTGIIEDFVINSGCTNTDIAADTTVAIGSIVKGVAHWNNGSLIWGIKVI